MATMTQKPELVKGKGPARKKPTKKRWVNWHVKPAGLHPFGVLLVKEQVGNGKVTEFLYFVRSIPSDIGVGVEFSELDGSGDCYQTSVDPQAEPDSGADHCNCLGWEKWGRCKHVAALRALLAQGRLW